jgi:hypothetical protein
MTWHVNLTWHNLIGLILSLTLPGHYWITLTIHAYKIGLSQGITAPIIAVPARRILRGLYAVSWLGPMLRTQAARKCARWSGMRGVD